MNEHVVEHGEEPRTPPRRGRNRAEWTGRDLADEAYDRAVALAEEVVHAERSFDTATRKILFECFDLIHAICPEERLAQFRRMWSDKTTKEDDPFEFSRPILDYLREKGIRNPHLRAANPFLALVQHFLIRADYDLGHLDADEVHDLEKTANDPAEQRRNNTFVSRYALLLLAAVDRNNKQLLTKPLMPTIKAYQQWRTLVPTLSAQNRATGRPKDKEKEKEADQAKDDESQIIDHFTRDEQKEADAKLKAAIAQLPDNLSSLLNPVEDTTQPVETRADDPVEVKADEIEATAEQPVETGTDEPVEVKADEIETKAEQPVETRADDPVEVKADEIEATAEQPVETGTDEPVEVKADEIEATAEQPVETGTDEPVEVKADEIETTADQPVVEPAVGEQDDVKADEIETTADQPVVEPAVGEQVEVKADETDTNPEPVTWTPAPPGWNDDPVRDNAIQPNAKPERRRKATPDDTLPWWIESFQKPARPVPVKLTKTAMKEIGIETDDEGFLRFQVKDGEIVILGVHHGVPTV